METVSINLSSLRPLYDCGNCGEHNARKLEIDCSNIIEEGCSFLVAVFRNEYNETMCSERFYEQTNGKIEVSLYQSLTKTGKEKLVIEAYSENENEEIVLLKKSPVIYLSFESSISSNEVLLDDNIEGVYKELIEMASGFSEGMEILDGALEDIDNLNISAVRGNNGVIITVTDKSGNETSVTVYDGQGGGDSSTFIANYDYDGDTYICDKTFTEIVAAYESGHNVIAAVNGYIDNATTIFRLTGYQANRGAAFTYCAADGAANLIHVEDDSIHIVKIDFDEFQRLITVGKGLSLANSVMSAVPRRLLFVSALPTTDIDQEAIYLRKHARYFPQLVDSQGNSLIQQIEGVDQKVAVTEDGKFIRFNTTGNTFYSSYNTIKAFEYDIYITDGTSWTYASSSTTGGDTSWATAMGWDVTKTYSNILYSNCDFRYTGAYKHYDPSTNRAKVDGTAEDTSTLPPYILMMWEYNGSSWKELGICDFSELFRQRKATLTNNTTVALKDGYDYSGESLTTVTFTFPSGDFESYISIATASSGTIAITFPNTAKWIGDEPTYENGKQYEFSIKNGVIVAGVIE